MKKLVSHHNKNYTKVSHHAPNTLKMTDPQWGWWLAGLIDGDGHFNKLGYLVVVFHLNCTSTAYALKRRIGSGKVSRVKGKLALTYVLSNRVGRTDVAHVVRDKLRHPIKIDQYNTRFAPKLNLPATGSGMPLAHWDHWLAGFIQSDGSFQIKALQLKLSRGKKKKPRPEFRVVLQIDQADRRLLAMIQACFGGSIGYRAKQNTYYYSSVSFHNAVALIHYLDHHQMHGHKMTAYKLWRQSYVLIQNKEHLTDAGCRKILNLKQKLSRLLQGV
jgi:hypothetical protein